ncbi:dienelactone hydrolase family protein [Eremomyces bilateralis CBS 781.70]|uniref:Dienelactone hydrolase family protein n=1 Tax=Eremomyces bilateralis CBS 781.70 TaxID=1392243 RepID=A0A6G1GFM1_9PEZI|nr:dienelactone hydrolase family protein [Eremomyces bilateralis CBS 781.70]KAF1816716.1 dienelactone hydrolase family protein [Eremomyces bilateralis CBS 781.70]
MTSHQPAQCCAVGVKHEGEAAGEVKLVGDVETYFAYPKDKSTTNAILILTDVLGHKFINVQLIADQFAANGFFVVVPDLFQGDPVPVNGENFDFGKWLPKHHTGLVDPVVSATLKHMREDLGCKWIGGVGYCFGAKYVARFQKKGGGLDAGYMAHPSFVAAEEFAAIDGPLSIAAAETDEIFPASKRHESEAILNKMDIAWQINLFSDVVHGFSVRADLSNKRAKFAKEQAFLQAVTWFNYHVTA